MTRPAAVRQSDVTRAIKAAQAAGLEVEGYEVRPDGSIRVFAKTGEDRGAVPADLAKWEREHRYAR